MKEKSKDNFPPSETCFFCNKKIEDVGGKRIIAKNFKGVVLSDEYRGGGNAEYPHQSVKLDDNSGKYIVVWGAKSEWTKEMIEKARKAFLNGLHPWFCQLCGNRECHECGFPINYPMGCDILGDTGCSSHIGMLPINPGCSNPDCDNYREWHL